MALLDEASDLDLQGERDEARLLADAAVRGVAYEEDGDVHFRDPRGSGMGDMATLWLAAEVRAARLERACEVG